MKTVVSRELWGFYQGWAVPETDMQEVILHLLIHLENINEINLKTVFKTEKKKKKSLFSFSLEATGSTVYHLY